MALSCIPLSCILLQALPALFCNAGYNAYYSGILIWSSRGRTSSVNWNLLYPEEPYRNNKLIFRKPRYSKDDSWNLRKLLKNISLSHKGKKSDNLYGSKLSGSLYNPVGKKQFCMVKMRYGDKLNSHRKFLERYMPQNDKSEVKEKPTVFGTEDYKEHMTGRHFKFIVSPESPNVPMELFVKAWVEKAELETGYKFDYQAVIHRNTAHPHAHILINGKDLKGKKIRFKPDFLKRRVIQMSSNICTSMIGERTHEQIALSLDRSFTADRWTNHDEKILSLCGNTADTEWPQSIKPVSDELSRRLSHLEELRLAKYDSETGDYLLQKKWDSALREVGRYNSYLTVRDELLWTMPGNMDLYTDSTGPVSGTVRKIILMNDEDIWNNAIVVENKEQHKAWYIPMFKPPKKQLDGKNITVSMTHNSRGLLVPVITEKQSNIENKIIRRSTKEEYL
jgi:hypothetical protein